MKAIITKYAGGKYFIATDTDNRVRYERDNAIEFERNHDEAALKLCAKLDWKGTLIKGEVGNNQRAYVWSSDTQIPVSDPNPVCAVTREEAITLTFALRNYIAALRKDIDAHINAAGCAMAIVDAKPLLGQIEAWLEGNPRK